MKTNRIPFRFDKYYSGKYNVISRGGDNTRIICDNCKGKYPIVALVESKCGDESLHCYLSDGRISESEESISDLFLEETIYEDGDIIRFGYKSDSIGIFKYIAGSIHSNYVTLTGNVLNYYTFGWTNDNMILATEKERQKLFDALKADGKRWNDKKKCIEDIKEECQFKPFDRVLVRDDNFSEWQADIFSNLCKVPEYPYVCVGGGWAQCILYKGNEELLGTHNTK